LLIYRYPKTAEISEEEYNMCMAQWNSMPNLVEILTKAGKLPKWLKDK